MFSSFYWLDLHKETRIALVALMMKLKKNFPDWKLDFSWFGYDNMKCMFIDSLTDYVGFHLNCVSLVGVE